MSEELLQTELVKLIKTSKDTPEAQDRFKLLKEIMEQPQKDFTGALINPILEEFHEQMQPIYEAASPLMGLLVQILLTLAIPLLKGFMSIVHACEGFFGASSKLIGMDLSRPSDAMTNTPTGRYPSGKIEDIENRLWR